MNQNEGLKSDLARVRGLGSAKSGTGHWVGMHYTSLALVPLGVWFAFSMFICIGTADYAAARAWFQSPINSALMILFILVGAHHAVSGLQVVVEDYIHAPFCKHAKIIGTRFLFAALAVLATLSVLKIFLGL